MLLRWPMIRRHYASLFEQYGRTQDAIAQAAGLQQNMLSRICAPHELRRGPSVEVFMRALYGIGKNPAQFFIEVEALRVSEQIDEMKAAYAAAKWTRKRHRKKSGKAKARKAA